MSRKELGLLIALSPSLLLEVSLAAAAVVRPHAVRQCHVAVPGPADDRQAAVADARGHPGGMEHLHGLLPGTAPGRLLVRSRHHHLARRAPPGAIASRRPAPAALDSEPHRGSRSA